MTLDAALLAIAKFPSDESLRLNCAAIYEATERSARARFIRLQLQIAKLEGGVDNPSWLSMQAEARELLQLNYSQWTGAYDQFRPQYHGGFIELVKLSATDLFDEEVRSRLFNSLPIRHVDVTDIGVSSTPFDSRPKNPPARSEILSAILNLSETHQLVSLGLDRIDLEDRDVFALVDREIPFLRNLQWVGLAGNNLTRNATIPLSMLRGRAPNLQFIDLTGNPYDPRSALRFDQNVVIDIELESNDNPDTVSLFYPTVIGGYPRSRNRFELVASADVMKAQNASINGGIDP